jgi:PII-like signaling protein
VNIHDPATAILKMKPLGNKLHSALILKHLKGFIFKIAVEESGILHLATMLPICLAIMSDVGNCK